MLDQNNHVDNLSNIDINLDQRKNLSLSLMTSGKEVVQSKIGQLLWLCNQRRPDISFQIRNLAYNLNKVNVNELIHCNEIILKVKDTD